MTQIYQPIPRHPARPPEDELLPLPQTWPTLFQQLRDKCGLQRLIKAPTVGERYIYFHGLCDEAGWPRDKLGWALAPWSQEAWIWQSEPERWPANCGREDLRFLRSGGMSPYEGSRHRVAFFEVHPEFAPELAADLPFAAKKLHEARDVYRATELALKKALASVQNRYAQRVAAAELGLAREESRYLDRVNRTLLG